MILEETLHESAAYLSFLNRNYLFERDVYQHFLGYVLNHSQSEIGYLHLVKENESELELAVWSDKVFEECMTAHSSHYSVDDAGIWADCIRTRSPVVHNNYPDIESNHKKGLPKGHFPVLRHASFPVIRSEKVVAVIGIGNRDTPYTEAEIHTLHDYIQSGWLDVTRKIHSVRKREFDRIKKYQSIPHNETLIKILGSISNAFELRDEYTSEHQRNVSVLANKIALALELSKRQIEAVTIGALVHDIGKMAVPTEILNKLRPLLPAEYSLIQLHSTAGAEIFRNIDLPFSLAEMIEQHHERIDGSGYPKGLKGDEIVLEARIIAVADTFDAMATDRPYRYSPGRSKAIEELKNGRNMKYDPYIVDRFIELLESDPELQPGEMYP
ncbi:MAG: HD domain-containing phosphohydrolase [Kangiellaceae bacterium]|nr:HD domain-containing phosphohydrolase [Kangiellaceae bacterium]